MKVLTGLIIAALLAVPALNAMPIPSQTAEDGEEYRPAYSGGAEVPDWGRTWGWVSVGCAGLGTLMLIDSSSGNNAAAVVLLLPGIAWLVVFGK